MGLKCWLQGTSLLLLTELNHTLAGVLLFSSVLGGDSFRWGFCHIHFNGLPPFTSWVSRIAFYFCYFSLGQGLKSCPAQKRKYLLVMKCIISWYNNHAVPYHKLKLTWLVCNMKPSLSSSATISLPMTLGLSRTLQVTFSVEEQWPCIPVSLLFLAFLFAWFLSLSLPLSSSPTVWSWWYRLDTNQAFWSSCFLMLPHVKPSLFFLC